jgi:hypothetical protein
MIEEDKAFMYYRPDPALYANVPHLNVESLDELGFDEHAQRIRGWITAAITTEIGAESSGIVISIVNWIICLIL